MWRDHPFSQRNNTTEWAAVGLEAPGTGVWTKFDKGVVNKRDLHKIVGGGRVGGSDLSANYDYSFRYVL